MASTARELHYGRGGSVYGNLAYDLEREVRVRQPHRETEERLRQAEPQVRSISRVQVRERQKIPALAVVGFCAVIALSILVLMSYVQLTELSAQTVKMRGELTALQTENVTLTAQYEKMYDLSAVKEAAQSVGMAKPSASQIYYIDLSDGDSAVVYEKKDAGILTRLTDSLSHGFYAVMEYFD
jgi:hypothetical protein